MARSSGIPFVYFDNSPLNSTEGFSTKVPNYAVLKAVFLKTKNVPKVLPTSRVPTEPKITPKSNTEGPQKIEK